MPFSANGTYTPTNGAENAFAGQTIASATWNAIFTDLSTALTLLAKGPAPVTGATFISMFKTAVDFNAAGTDNSVTVTLPTGVTNFLVTAIRIANASASISTATVGLFTAAGGSGGGGTVIVASGAALTVTTSLPNTNNNAMAIVPTTSGTQSYNVATLFFRIGAAQGSPATADVTIQIVPLP